MYLDLDPLFTTAVMWDSAKYDTNPDAGTGTEKKVKNLEKR